MRRPTHIGARAVPTPGRPRTGRTAGAAPPASGLRQVEGVSPQCRVCQELEGVPTALLLFYIALAWTPFRPRRMTRFLFEHDFGCDERFARWA